MDKRKSSGAPPWMATFADLSTLLLTFFVLMLSMASIDIQKFREMLGSVKDAFGVTTQQVGEYQPVISPDKPQSRDKLMEMIQQPPKAPSKPTPAEQQREAEDAMESSRVAAQVEQMVKITGLDKVTEVTSGKRGVRLRVKGGLLFDPGRAQLKPTAHRLLDGVIKVLKKTKFFLIVEGHTDNVPIKTDMFPSNWELSAARATAVVRYLAQKGGIAPRRLSAVGFGPNYPIRPNTSGEGRAANRRVEFIFTKLTPRVAVK